MARVDTLPHFLTDVADAIREKKGTSETIQASDFDTEIENLPSGADIDDYINTTISSNTSYGTPYCKLALKKIPEITITSAVTSLANAFSELNISEISFSSNSDVSNVTNVSGMFQQVTGLTNLDLRPLSDFGKVTSTNQMFASSSIQNINLSGIDFSGATAMNSMFTQAQGIQTIDMSNVDASSATNLNTMFNNCKNLTSLNVSGMDISSATKMESMFYYCEKLTTLDLSSFTTANVTNMYGTFQYCNRLQHLDIRNFTFDNVTADTYMFSGVPNACEIIVKGDTEKTWITDKFSNLTNVKTVAEYEAEQNA